MRGEEADVTWERVLIEGLRGSGSVEVIRPIVQLPIFTATRVLFNEAPCARDFHADATVGIDADGYSIAGRRKSPHIAGIKGVLGYAVRFEASLNRLWRRTC